MRILYHHRTLGDGAEGIHIQSIVNCLKDQGHEVRVASLVGEQTQFRTSQEAKESKWDKIKNIIPKPVYELAEIAYNLKGKSMLMSAIKDFKPDIIYDRYAHFSFSALWAAKKAGLPLILEINSPYSIQKRQWEKVYFPGLSKMGEQKIFAAAPRIIVVSSPLKQIVADYGVDTGKVTVLPNGTDATRFDPHLDASALKKELSLEGKTILGFVGILRSWHNIDKLINILEDIDLKKMNAAMVFLGDGPSYDELVAYNKEKGNEETIRFLGRVQHNEIQKYIAMFDIAISPHATPYSSPMKILEYMAMEKAILAPDMPNIKDMIENGKNGVLFTPDDADSLKKNLLQLIENNESRIKVGKQARQDVLEKFTWSNNARLTAEIAEDLVSDYMS
ncbi:MAG: glycosyltransferase family 1 protein [Calditrichaeota bacterium]|nr:MAG: glycosyltransferase family 1 protein [Calditrichota bacterium]MBL1206341.1 glycosyltransferase family 1 protein [Calditrichota bacterium]NOG46167.1 glycosyltransferase family 4 protein [Calditrichota bacterium]